MWTFVCKFTKRRCVTYLAKDGLAPRHEEDESAIRQMLKKFRTNLGTGKTSATAQPTDTCFRCHKLGHWAAECPEGHEPEWLAQQKCFYYGQQGRIRKVTKHSICLKSSKTNLQL